MLTNVDEDDDDPEDTNPSCDGHGIGPEAQYGHYTLQFVGDRDPIREPVGPSQSKSSGWINEFVGPLNELGVSYKSDMQDVRLTPPKIHTALGSGYITAISPIL